VHEYELRKKDLQRMIRFRCSKCGQKFSVPEKFIGQALVCQVCEIKVPVPEQSTIAERAQTHNPPSLPQAVSFVPLEDSEEATLQYESEIPVSKPIKETPEIINPQISSPVPELTVPELVPVVNVPTVKPATTVPALNKPSLSEKKAPSIVKPSLNKAPVINKAPSIKSAPAIKKAPAVNQAPVIKPAPAINKAPAPVISAPKVTAQTSAAPITPNHNLNECVNHPGEPASEKCLYCGKVICWKCKSELKGCCSELCMGAAVIKAQEATYKKEQKQYAVAEIVTKIIKYTVKLAIVGVVIAIGWWIWVEFLDPGGKLAWKWEKSFSVGNFNFLSYDKDKINFIAGDHFRSIDTQTGKVLTDRTEKKLEDCSQLMNHSGNKYIFRAKECIQVLDGEGNIAWRKEFKHPVYIASASEHAVIVQTSLYIKAKSRKEKPKIIRHMYALDAKDGKELWTLKLDKSSYYSAITVGKDYYAYVSGGYRYGVPKDQQPKIYLRIFKIKDNKFHFRIPLKDSFAQPMIIDGNIIFKNKDKLYAVNIAKSKQLWKLPVKGHNWGRNLKKHDGMIFFTSGGTLTTVDLKQGKVLWTQKAPADSTTRFSYGNGKLYFFGTKKIKLPQKDVKQRKLPKAYEDLKKDNPLLQEFTDGEARKYKYETIITCVDAATGKELWVCGEVFGRLVLGNKKAVLLRDTARSGMLGVISTKGETVVEQLDPADGDRLFMRTDSIGVKGPFIIAGDKLVGMINDRGATFGRTALMSRKVNYLGMAAFNLK
jgi:PQQ-like domain